jgi:hypothetical protein
MYVYRYQYWKFSVTTSIQITEKRRFKIHHTLLYYSPSMTHREMASEAISKCSTKHTTLKWARFRPSTDSSHASLAIDG